MESTMGYVYGGVPYSQVQRQWSLLLLCLLQLPSQALLLFERRVLVVMDLKKACE